MDSYEGVVMSNKWVGSQRKSNEEGKEKKKWNEYNTIWLETNFFYPQIIMKSRWQDLNLSDLTSESMVIMGRN